MKKFWTVYVLLAVIASQCLIAENTKIPLSLRWDKVQKLTDKNLPESALTEVELIIKQAGDEKQSVELIKAIIVKAGLVVQKNPDSAPAQLKQIESVTDSTKDRAERAILHSMLAELYLQYYQKDSWKINNRTETTGFIPENINEWTKINFYRKISQHFAASLADESVLQKTDVLKYKMLLDRGEDSRNMQPTLFDFLAHRLLTKLKEMMRYDWQDKTYPDVNVCFTSAAEFCRLKADTVVTAHFVCSQITETYKKLLDFNLKKANIPALIYTDLQRLKYYREGLNNELKDSLYVNALSNLEKLYPTNEMVVEVMAARADFYQSSNKRKAYDICMKGLKTFPQYQRISMLTNIRNKILNKTLQLSNKNVARPGSELELQFVSSNITKLKVKLYRVNGQPVDYYKFKINRQNKHLEYSNKMLIDSFYVAVKCDSNFLPVKTVYKLKTDKFGIYEFTAEADNKQDIEEKTCGNYTVTNFAYIFKSQDDNQGAIYLVDRESGQPQANVRADIYNLIWKYPYNDIVLDGLYNTDKNGLLTFTFDKKYQNNRIFFFRKGEDCFFSSASNYYNYPYYRDDDEDLHHDFLSLFTDRAVYRPGQVVSFKGIAYKLSDNKRAVISNSSYEVSLYDANNQKIESKSFTTNEFGSFSGTFSLPTGGLNGNYSLQSAHFSSSFRVEEYKRPTFEVSIKKPEKEVKFGEKISLQCHTKSYAGHGISGAGIKYQILRKSHPLCRWFNESEHQIASGTLKSNSDGLTEISFMPEKPQNKQNAKGDQIYTYIVRVEATDPKGETQKGEQELAVGEKSLIINANIPARAEKTKKLGLDVSTVSVNYSVINSDIHYCIQSLRDTDSYAENLQEMENFPVERTVLEGNFNTRNKKPEADLSKFPSGRYKITFSTTDQFGRPLKQENIVLLYDKNDTHPPVKTYSWLLCEKTEFEPGETAHLKFGSSTVNSKVLYELIRNNTVIESRWIAFSNEIKSFDIPFPKSSGKPLEVCFTFVKDEKLHTQSVILQRKTPNRKLTPTLSVFRDKLQPGEKANWIITVPECVNRKKAAELMVGMYDASLDIIQPNTWNFYPVYQSYYYNLKWNAKMSDMNFDNTNNYSKNIYTKNLEFDSFNWFGVKFNNQQIMIRGLSSVSEDVTTLNEAVVVGYGTEKKVDLTGAVSSVRVRGVSSEDSLDEVKSAITEEPGSDSVPLKNVHIRTDFNETAFFYPQLQTDINGKVSFSFTAPESLTRWNVKMLAHTADLCFGQQTVQVVTQKDFMVQMNLPRFVRKSDKLTLSATVVNLSNKECKAAVKLEMTDPESDKVISIKENEAKQLVLAARETKVVTWKLDEFSPYDLVICKVIAGNSDFSDGEQKYLPVLPDKVLVTETMPMTIRAGQTRTFQFESLISKWSKVDSRNLSIEFSSNPVWYAVQALPTYSIPETKNAIDYFTAYYSNTLASYISSSNPKIERVFNSWLKTEPDKKTLQSNLEKNQELKNMLLDETPWVTEARDEADQKRSIAMLFNLNKQNSQNEQYLKKLMEMQLPSGGFPWFTGMYESRYITMEILLNMARLNRLTGQSLNELYQPKIIKALEYLDNEMARDYNQLKERNKDLNNIKYISNDQMFYLHVRSEYPDAAVTENAKEAIRFFRTKAEKYWTELTLYGQAMLAIIAKRNGNNSLSADIIRSLKENALKADDSGMYWAANSAGYFWDRRPIGIQAAIIEAFSEIQKTDPDIDEMRMWLLKQKQTQRWDSPLSTVDAIYALLNRGTGWIENNGNVSITIGSEPLSRPKAETGTGYFKQTLPVGSIKSETANVTLSNPNKSGFGWGAMYWQFYQDISQVSAQNGSLSVSKKLFVEKITATGRVMMPAEQTVLKKGDKVITRLTVVADRNYDFVALKDLRASCFEPVNQRSGCEWKEGLCYYQSSKDASTQFFFSYLPKGTYVFDYELWVNASGQYSSGMASIQCHYAPEFISHSGGERITVAE